VNPPLVPALPPRTAHSPLSTPVPTLRFPPLPWGHLPTPAPTVAPPSQLAACAARASTSLHPLLANRTPAHLVFYRPFPPPRLAWPALTPPAPSLTPARRHPRAPPAPPRRPTPACLSLPPWSLHPARVLHRVSAKAPSHSSVRGFATFPSPLVPPPPPPQPTRATPAPACPLTTRRPSRTASSRHLAWYPHFLVYATPSSLTPATAGSSIPPPPAPAPTGHPSLPLCRPRCRSTNAPPPAPSPAPLQMPQEPPLPP